MRFGPKIDQLIEALQCLPGVGPKSAQRMTLHLLERDREGGEYLSAALVHAIEKVGRCTRCRNLSEDPICPICASTRRDQGLVCVVETPADVFAVEQAGGYAGLYFVLLGRLSPIDGVGPAELGLELLGERVREEGIKEVILATNPTVEGEATAYFITEQLRTAGVTVSRIAHGVPLGGELEYVDGGTLQHAFLGRKPV
ncbi:MAG: recombination protein RecR [Pseudomonadales bacterium]|nr:recombination protein RecR [Pseudomonadales bacterium]